MISNVLLNFAVKWNHPSFYILFLSSIFMKLLKAFKVQENTAKSS